ncbi:CaiB/BaiF CoA transferase family protein [Nocardia sp. CA-120079]|uniref:CaiB/BaiF CoA transferase family protein n=1 Tax=Nocardia sp. CA-120079 TaxID=3239974 RepID=UPI003D95609C
MADPTAGPLAGVTVVALEQAVSAPMCTRTLADFGARVIKIENPRGGDFARNYDDVVNGLAAHFVWVNRGKESVTLDLKDPEGIAVLHRLLDSADVFVSNLAPGATAALGLATDELALRHPDVIAMEIDGYGPGGPLSHKRAYDLLIQAESGVCAVTGFPDAPAKPGPPIADVCSGLYAALTIVAMICGRRASREPATKPAAASVSLFDTAAELMGYALNYTRHTGIDQQPLGMSSPAVAPYGAYPTGDGRTVVLGTTNDREWQRLARDILNRPDLAEDPRFTTNAGRVRHRAELDATIAQWCARHDLATVQLCADAAGIGNSRYNTPTDVIAHPHLAARRRWRPIETPAGPVPALLPPPVIAGYEPPMGAIPALGQHTETVLAAAGFSADDIARLRDRGAIGPGADQPVR